MEDRQISYQFRVKLCGKDKFFGPGVAELMHYVDELRSLNKAAAKMHMAYSKAWKIIGHAEEELGYALFGAKDRRYRRRRRPADCGRQRAALAL